MTHDPQNISAHHRGDAVDITTIIETPDGALKDLTGVQSAEYVIKSDPSDADADAKLTLTQTDGNISVLDAGNGKLEISIETGDTGDFSPGTFHHRLRVTDGDGDRVTVFTGEFEVVY